MDYHLSFSIQLEFFRVNVLFILGNQLASSRARNSVIEVNLFVSDFVHVSSSYVHERLSLTFTFLNCIEFHHVDQLETPIKNPKENPPAEGILFVRIFFTLSQYTIASSTSSLPSPVVSTALIASS
mmetsp:Transcript_2416/g.3592  ORF Transcript_2416/g.3592 Transcript_2416/m.3592 type:complete len:126 (-) Transcript_2416:342-719(-)